MPTPSELEAINEAAALAGGQKALADAVGEHKSFINQLCKGLRPTPPAVAQKVETATGVTCERLREDVQWTRINGVITGYHVPLPPANEPTPQRAEAA